MSLDSGIEQQHQLVRRVLAGEKEEFRHLVQSHQNYVFSMLYRQIGDFQIARDLTQEVFVRAFTKLHQFRFESSFRTWLVRIALSIGNSYFSTRAYKEQQRNTVLEPADLDQLVAERDESEFSENTIAKLRAHVASLPEQYREVITLCAFENKSYREAAAILSIPEGTVGSRLNKALALLKRKFFGNGGRK